MRRWSGQPRKGIPTPRDVEQDRPDAPAEEAKNVAREPSATERAPHPAPTLETVRRSSRQTRPPDWRIEQGIAHDASAQQPRRKAHPKAKRRPKAEVETQRRQPSAAGPSANLSNGAAVHPDPADGAMHQMVLKELQDLKARLNSLPNASGTRKPPREATRERKPNRVRPHHDEPGAAERPPKRNRGAPMNGNAATAPMTNEAGSVPVGEDGSGTPASARPLPQVETEALQAKIDQLDEAQLERVLDFLAPDLGEGSEDQEVQLELDKLSAVRQHALVQFVEAELASARAARAASGAVPAPVSAEYENEGT